MTSDIKASAIPEPKIEHDDNAWTESAGAVEQIKATTIANTDGLGSSIEGKERTLRRQTSALRDLRLARKLTQQQLAATDGAFSQAHISKMENGDAAALALATLERFVKASGGELKVSAVYGNDTYPLDFNNEISEGI